MDKRLKTALILAGVAVAVYLGYRWYQNRQSNSQGLGANLNSAAPELVAGSSGPSSGLNYYAGSTTVDITEPVTSTQHGKIPIGPGDGGVTTPAWIGQGSNGQGVGNVNRGANPVTGTVESYVTPLATTQFGGTGATG